MATIFKQIIDKIVPADIIYENDELICIKDINPVAPIHLLIIPKKEIPTINDIHYEDRELIGNMFMAAKKLAKMLSVDEKGYRLIMNCNNDGCQSVFHLHLHFLGGKKLSWESL
tara:strand:+ start:52 stop:393 length:342 start_codon:yes stop_codon:yes gene_type:complete